MSSSTIAISGFMILMIAIAAGIIVLQVFLSRKENKWAGLILPFISFGFSILTFYSFVFFSPPPGTITTFVDGEFVTTQIAPASSIIASAIYLFLLYNIPTGILLAIYAACRGKQKRQRDLEKMSVQDLG